MQHYGFLLQLNRWFKTEGETVLKEERHLIDAAIERLFGYFMVQLETINHQSLMSASRVGHRVLLSSESALIHAPREENEYLVLADLDFIPIAKDSVDLFLLPHTLELAEDPLLLLRQIDAMLIAEGHLVITGFNPRGAFVFWKRWFGRSKIFAEANLESATTLTHWLRVLGYEITALKYTPAVFHPKADERATPLWQRRLQSLMHRLGFGNVYCLMARKHQDAPTLVGMKWHTPRWRSLGARTPASNRSHIRTTQQKEDYDRYN